MLYYSPIRWLFDENEALPQTIEKQHLRLAPKRLLAELELTDAPHIAIGGLLLLKDDVLRLYETLNDLPTANWHLRVFHFKPLLDFLENARIPRNKELATTNRWLNDPVFLEIFGPYLAAAYAQAWIFAFEAMDAEAAGRVRRFVPPWRGEDQAAAMQQIRAYHRRDLAWVRSYPELDASGPPLRSERSYFIFHARLVDVLNSLPESLGDLRDDYGYAWAEYLDSAAKTMKDSGRLSNFADLFRLKTNAQVDEHMRFVHECLKKRRFFNFNWSSYLIYLLLYVLFKLLLKIIDG